MPSHSTRHALRSLYVILDPAVLHGRSLVETLIEAAAGGARLFQYRDKRSSGLEMFRRAERLRRAAADAAAIFLVNDRCDLAMAVDADGVHLGQEDLPPALARSLLGSEKIIGVSTHRSEQVTEATRAGADYVGFGPIFSTGTKPDHEPVVGVESLREVRRLTALPIFAIGGVTLEQVEKLVAAGANGVAVISAVSGASDVPGAVRAFMARLP